MKQMRSFVKSVMHGRTELTVRKACLPIRANSALKLPDAIHFASAINQRCDSFLTNDDRFEGMTGINVVLLSLLAIVAAH